MVQCAYPAQATNNYYMLASTVSSCNIIAVSYKLSEILSMLDQFLNTLNRNLSIQDNIKWNKIFLWIQ
jgi:hypothetical protein